MRVILDEFSKRFFLIVVMALMMISTVASASVSPIEAMAQIKLYAIPLIFVWEYLVGKSKLKSNSTIDLIIVGVKKLLGISGDDLKLA